MRLKYSLCKILLYSFFVICSSSIKIYADNISENMSVFQKEIDLLHHEFKCDLQDTNCVKRLINHMYTVDQKVRKEFMSRYHNRLVRQFIQKMDQTHTRCLKNILSVYEWIIISRFGSESDHQSWLLVQHADQDLEFQVKILKILERLSQNHETDIKNYAYLYDRVALKSDQFQFKQKYGTQVDVKNNEVNLLPYEGTLKEVDQRRKIVGLDPLQLYFQQVKEIYANSH